MLHSTGTRAEAETALQHCARIVEKVGPTVLRKAKPKTRRKPYKWDNDTEVVTASLVCLCGSGADNSLFGHMCCIRAHSTAKSALAFGVAFAGVVQCLALLGHT